MTEPNLYRVVEQLTTVYVVPAKTLNEAVLKVRQKQGQLLTLVSDATHEAKRVGLWDGEVE